MCYNVRDWLIKNACIHLSHILTVFEINPFSRIDFFFHDSLNFPKMVSEVWPLPATSRLLRSVCWGLRFCCRNSVSSGSDQMQSCSCISMFFFHRGVDSVPWGPLCFRCMELWEAVLFPCLAPYWGKGLWILHKYLAYPSLTSWELLILLLNKEKSFAYVVCRVCGLYMGKK